MFGISGEHLVVLVVILLIFGPKRLPQLGNTLGKAIKNFKDSVSGIEEARFRKLDDDSNAAELVKNNPAQTATPQAATAPMGTASTSTINTTTTAAVTPVDPSDKKDS
ncbi:MAG: twin-arginine translocase TatA/TatE family subunit [Proteobacteria bacterium]|nr:MAG: twin-arginine translocase TatA/TatE family subunit [Pseudomonadota bacterium]